MSDEVLVRVDGVSKKFCKSLKRSLLYGAADVWTELSGGGKHDDLRAGEFWAVKDLSFELKRLFVINNHELLIKNQQK